MTEKPFAAEHRRADIDSINKLSLADYGWNTHFERQLEAREIDEL